MTDHPIIFSASMVKALLEGRKTQTRRLLWRERRDVSKPLRLSPWQRVVPGDRLWVREAWAPISPDENERPIRECNIEYRADTAADAPGHWDCMNKDERPDYARWRPSIYMPRWASRLTLTVTAVKIERIQEISREDQIAEGTPDDMCFNALWSSIYGAESWEANPEVIAISFCCHKTTIDQLKDAA